MENVTHSWILITRPILSAITQIYHLFTLDRDEMRPVLFLIVLSSPYYYKACLSLRCPGTPKYKGETIISHTRSSFKFQLIFIQYFFSQPSDKPPADTLVGLRCCTLLWITTGRMHLTLANRYQICIEQASSLRDPPPSRSSLLPLLRIHLFIRAVNSFVLMYNHENFPAVEQTPTLALSDTNSNNNNFIECKYQLLQIGGRMFQNSGRQAEIHRMDGEGAFLDKKKDWAQSRHCLLRRNALNVIRTNILQVDI